MCAELLRLGCPLWRVGGHARGYDHHAIEELIARANGHRGRTLLAQATAAEPKFTRSELEAWLLSLVREIDLPEPQVNATLAAPDHPRLEVDFCWPSQRLIVELAAGTPTTPEPPSNKTAAATPPCTPIQRRLQPPHATSQLSTVSRQAGG